MKNALILHGTNANHLENWFPWLEQELKESGYMVWVPDLPGADKPDLAVYNQHIFSTWKFNSDSIIVGHSSGAVAILALLENLPDSVQIDTAYLVAGFTDDLGWESLQKLFIKPFDWKKIRRKARKFILIHSDNDPYVPLAHGEKLKELLGAELLILQGQGHFSLGEDRPRFKQLPELLEKIIG